MVGATCMKRAIPIRCLGKSWLQTTIPLHQLNKLVCRSARFGPGPRSQVQVAVGCRVGEAWIGSAYICRRPR